MIAYLVSKIYSQDIDKIISEVKFIKQYDLYIDSNEMIEILICAEDKRFLHHPGFDFVAIIRAIFFYFVENRKSGASTITQQLVRTITNKKENTVKRKVREILLAIAIENIFDKHTIAKSYLMIAYYGWNMDGLHNAFKRVCSIGFFDKDDSLYAIVAMLKYPLSRFYDEKNLRRIRNRIIYIKKKRGILLY